MVSTPLRRPQRPLQTPRKNYNNNDDDDDDDDNEDELARKSSPATNSRDSEEKKSFTPLYGTRELLSLYSLDAPYPSSWTDASELNCAISRLRSRSILKGSSASLTLNSFGDGTDPLGVIEGSIFKSLEKTPKKPVRFHKKSPSSASSASGTVLSPPPTRSPNDHLAHGRKLSLSSLEQSASSVKSGALKFARKLKLGGRAKKSNKDSSSLPMAGGSGGQDIPRSESIASHGDDDGGLNALGDSDNEDPTVIEENYRTSHDDVVNNGLVEAETETSTPRRFETLSILSREFDPKRFLAIVHSATQFRDFEAGLARLQNAGAAQSEVMRKLVRENFDDFVTAKAAVDTIFRNRRLVELHPAKNCSTDGLSEALELSDSTARQVFMPILHRRTQAEKIKSTLAVLERFKYFFNLPNTIRSAFQHGNLPAAVRDFKKGRTLVLSMYPSLINGTTTGEIQATKISNVETSEVKEKAQTTTTSTQQKQQQYLHQQQRLFERVWGEVVFVIQHVKENLFAQLSDHSLMPDVQQQAISLILEIDPEADPLAVYLEGRCKWILAQMRNTVISHSQHLSELMEIPQKQSPGFTPIQFRRAVMLRNKKEFDSVFARNIEVIMWQGFTSTVRSLSEVLSSSLPDFWKIAHAFTDHSNKSTIKSARRNAKATQIDICYQMLNEIFSYFKCLVDHVFNGTREEIIPNNRRQSKLRRKSKVHGDKLIEEVFIKKELEDEDRSQEYLSKSSDLGSLVESNFNEFNIEKEEIKYEEEKKIQNIPAFPKLTMENSLTVAYFAPRILQSLSICMKQVLEFKIPITSNLLHKVSESVCSKFLEMLLKSWEKDVKEIPTLEEWRMDKGSAPSQMLFGAYQVFMVGRLYRFWVPPPQEIIEIEERKAMGTIEERKAIGKIEERKAIGKIEENKKQITAIELGKRFIKLTIDQISKMLSVYLEGVKACAFDSFSCDNPETRLLITTSNLSQLYDTVLPQILNTIEINTRSILESCYFNEEINIKQETKNLILSEIKEKFESQYKIVKEFDVEVMREFVYKQVNKLESYVRAAIIIENEEEEEEEIIILKDKNNIEIRSWVYHVLSAMVRVQVIVIEVNPTQAKRVLEQVHDGLVELMIRIFMKTGGGGTIRKSQKQKNSQIKIPSFVASQLLVEIEALRRVLSGEGSLEKKNNIKNNEEGNLSLKIIKGYQQLKFFLKNPEINNEINQITELVNEFVKSTRLQFTCLFYN